MRHLKKESQKLCVPGYSLLPIENPDSSTPLSFLRDIWVFLKKDSLFGAGGSWVVDKPNYHGNLGGQEVKGSCPYCCSAYRFSLHSSLFVWHLAVSRSLESLLLSFFKKQTSCLLCRWARRAIWLLCDGAGDLLEMILTGAFRLPFIPAVFSAHPHPNSLTNYIVFIIWICHIYLSTIYWWTYIF